MRLKHEKGKSLSTVGEGLAGKQYPVSHMTVPQRSTAMQTNESDLYCFKLLPGDFYRCPEDNLPFVKTIAVFKYI